MTRQDIIDKITKLLSLAGSENRAEAELAALRAQELMDRWQIEASEMERGCIEHVDINTGKVASTEWERMLVMAVARNNFCHVILKTEITGIKVLTVVGRKANLSASVEMYQFLHAIAVREWNAFRTDVANRRKKKNRNKFLSGFALAITHRMRFDSNARWSDGNGTELVRVMSEDEAAIIEYKQQQWPDLTTVKARPTKASAAVRHGAVAGINASLARQVQSNRLAIAGGNP